MSGNKLFVDTNIMLYFLKGEESIIEIFNQSEPEISFITEIELLAYKKITKKDEKLIRTVLSQILITNINQRIKDLAIEFRRKSNLKLPDAIIAASASYQNVPLLTADRDFNKIDEIDILLFEK